MTNFGKVVDILSSLLASNMELSKDEYYEKLIKVFNDATGHQMEITNPKFNTRLFNCYHCSIDYDDTPIANLIINIPEPDEDTINIINLISVLIKNKHYHDEMKILIRTINNGKNINNILSYSESEAVKTLFKDYETAPWAERNIITSKVADSAGITRSVIVNAIRKMEMTGIIKTTSLGMKGTIITVLSQDSLKRLLKII